MMLNYFYVDSRSLLFPYSSLILVSFHNIRHLLHRFLITIARLTFASR